MKNSVVKQTLGPAPWMGRQRQARTSTLSRGMKVLKLTGKTVTGPLAGRMAVIVSAFQPLRMLHSCPFQSMFPTSSDSTLNSRHFNIPNNLDTPNKSFA